MGMAEEKAVIPPIKKMIETPNSSTMGVVTIFVIFPIPMVAM